MTQKNNLFLASVGLVVFAVGVAAAGSALYASGYFITKIGEFFNFSTVGFALLSFADKSVVPGYLNIGAGLFFYTTLGSLLVVAVTWLAYDFLAGVGSTATMVLRCRKARELAKESSSDIKTF